MAKAVGIDLGTTNSVIAVLEGGDPTVIANAEGSRTTPSVVAFTDQGERLVGQLARRQAILNPKGTITSAKRFIGRRYDEVSSEATAVSFDVVAGPDGMARFDVRGKLYAPEEISALGAAQAGRGRRQVPGRAGHQGGDHRPGLLQRRPATGDQGRRADRRAGGPADHQRADRSRPGLRARQARARDGAGVRPRRRHLRRQPPGRRRRGGRGPGDLGRHPPGRRRLRPPAGRLPGRPVQGRAGHRPAQRPPGPAAAVRGGRAGQGRAVLGHPDPGQPAVRHRRRLRAQAPHRHPDAGEVRAAHRRPGRALPWAGQAGDERTPR